MNRRLLYLAILAAPLSAAGQDINFGDDSGNYPNDGECDDPRFEGPGAYTSPLEEDVLRDASDCLALFDSGQIWLVGEGPELFGALAIGDDLGYGGIVNTATQADADDAALSECGSVDSGCEIVARFGADMCVAVATDDEAGWIGWAAGPDSQETSEAAIDECMAVGGSGCTVEDLACTGATANIADGAEHTRFANAVAAEAPVASAPTTPSGPLCADTTEEACWMVHDTLPDCYIWNPRPQSYELDIWAGQCSGGLGTGAAVYRFGDSNEDIAEIPYVNGKIQGTMVRRTNSGVFETPYVNGEKHGLEVFRWAGGDVYEIPWVNDEKHGLEVRENLDGSVTEGRWENGEVVCTVHRAPNGRVDHNTCD